MSVHNTPSTLGDLADTPMMDTANPHASAVVLPSQALLRSEPNPKDLVGELLTDVDIKKHLSRPDRRSYLESLANMMKSSMHEINASGSFFDAQQPANHNMQIQNENHQAWYQPNSVLQPPPETRAGSFAQPHFATLAPPTNLNGMGGVSFGRPSDSLPFDNDPAQMSARERQLALARSLLEVPVDSNGVFHADGFAASGVDVEMLERDMDASIPFMRPTARS